MGLWGVVAEHLADAATLALVRALCDPIYRWLASWWSGRAGGGAEEARTLATDPPERLERAYELADSVTSLASRVYDWITGDGSGR